MAVSDFDFGTGTNPVITRSSLYTSKSEFRKVLSANSTANAYAAKTDAAGSTAPATAGYIDLSAGQLPDYVPNTVLLKFFGAGADNTTGGARVYGVRPCRNSANAVVSFTHTLLAQYSFTLSADVGVADGLVSATERYADTITRTTGIENVSDQMLSPTGDVSGHVLVDAKGHALLFVDPIIGTATSVNALYAGV